jgi:hypothetical protein
MCEAAQWDDFEKRWESFTLVARRCRYTVRWGREYVEVERGERRVFFIHSSEGLEAAEGWAEEVLGPELEVWLKYESRPSFWEVLKGLWQAMWR